VNASAARAAALPLTVLGALYFAQGLPFGFFTQALPVLLRAEGASLPAVGLSSLLAVPWALKFLWAPLVDRYGNERFGRRRSWLVPLQLASVLCFVVLGVLRPTGVSAVVLAVVLLANLFAATQDVATDALAVRLLPPERRGLGNGLQVGGYRLGMIVGGSALLALFARGGWRATAFAMAALLALASLPLWALREPSRSSEPKPGAARPRILQALASTFAEPGMLRWLGVLVTYKAGDALMSVMVRPRLLELEFGLEDLARVMGLGGSLAGLVGALLGGALVQPLGRRRALLAFGALQALSVAAHALLTSGSSFGFVTSIVLAEHVAGGMATAALFTTMMDRCREAHAATDYTAQSCAVVVANGLAATLSGYVAEALGWTAFFVVAAACCAAALGLAASRRVWEVHAPRSDAPA
jgi:MFS transporter, PAT family, beta-lactamase induction signal transducer AmpG